MEKANNKEFGKLRSIIFPIHQSEFRKFIPLTSIFFIISFNYSLLRSLKDMFIIKTAPAEVIYYLKVVGVMPYMILLTILYSKISKQVSRDTRFNIVIGFFLVTLSLCYFVLIPGLEAFQLNNVANTLNEAFPRFHGLWEAIRFWHLSFLYVNAEAWGTLALSVVFWTFVNEITAGPQAKRFYSFLSVGASIGLLMAGIAIRHLNLGFSGLLGFTVIFTAILLIIYNIFSYDIRKNPELYQVEQKTKKKKIKSSLVESIQFLASSKYLALIAALVLSYNMFISMFEAIWKAEIKELVKVAGHGKLSDIYGDQAIYSSFITLALTFFFSTPIMNRGWKFAASFTPLVAGICTIGFFSFLYFQQSLEFLTTMFSMIPLELAVFVGLINVSSIKSFKYIFFDPTKERAYLPLDEESKVRGKAAVDGIGSRLGKSAGSLILTAFLVPVLGNGQIINVRYYVFFILLAILTFWIVAIRKLNVLYHQRIAQEQEKEQQA